MTTLSDSPKTIRLEETPRSGTPSPAVAARRRGPFGLLLDFFSSVKLGIVLLSILFVYSSLGSAGLIYPVSPFLFSRDAWVHAQIRQWPIFEMTEYEWFHWWPFNLLILLICVNLIVATLRRIRLNTINLGVWMIHTGIIVLAVGSLIYFGTKVEGDLPIARRHVTIAVETPDGPVTTTILAMPGVSAELETPDGLWTFEIATIDPAWELLTGDAAGSLAYSVNVMVETPHRRFMRQLLDGHPELTEDIIVAADTGQPMQRAVRVTGDPIVEPRLTLGLEFEPAEWFYLRNDLVKSWALYVRRVGEREWVERPVHGLPFYNDYVSERGHVLQGPGDPPLRLRPIEVRVPAASPDDPIPDVDLRINGYLRFAQTRALLRPGTADDPINPALWVRVAAPEVEGPAARGTEYRMLALDPQSRRADGGLLAFRWAESEDEFKAIAHPPSLTFEIPHLGVSIDGPIRDTAVGNPELPFTPIDGPDGATGYAYRVMAIQDDLSLSVGVHSMAVVELRTPNGGTFRRWVFEDDALSRDVRDDAAMEAHGAPSMIDDSIRVAYRAGTGLALLTVVAGPDDQSLRLLVSFDESEPVVIRLEANRTHPLPGGLTLRVTDYYPRALVRPTPMVVPPSQRIRDAGEFFSQVRLEVDAADGTEATFANGSPWVLFHRYPFPGPDRLLRRHIYDPTVVRLEDGRQFEVVLSRRRLPLPAPMALDDFRLATHVGGFTGETLTIRNYTSHVRFRDEDGLWSAPVEVSVNAPIHKGGLQFFQAQWDPPDDARRAGPNASRGLNYTVLGVGSRYGVITQLVGCCIAVVGMLYAFYVKPVLKRRRQLAVEEALARGEFARVGSDGHPAGQPDRQPDRHSDGQSDGQSDEHGGGASDSSTKEKS